MDASSGDSILNLAKICPPWLQDVETQALIMAGLCFVGAWVVMVWIVQVLLSLLWPFIVVIALMVFLPSWRKTIVSEYLPKHLEVIRSWGSRVFDGLNRTRTG